MTQRFLLVDSLGDKQPAALELLLATRRERPYHRGMSVGARLARFFHPTREHSIVSAAALLMVATLLARVVGYVRDAYVAYAFGAGPLTDAYIAAFTLPDLLLHLLAGGSISITFISLYTRYIAEMREAEAQEVFSIVVSVLVVVFLALLVAAEFAAPWFVRWWFPGFSGEQARLCTLLTRILLPQPIFFLIGGVVSAVQQTRRQFLIPAIAPIVYTLFIILGGIFFSRQLGIASLAVGATVGALAGPFLLNLIGAKQGGISFRFRFQPRHPAFLQWLRLSIPLMLGVTVVFADDWILRIFASDLPGEITRLNYAKRLLQVPIGVLGQAAGLASLPFFSRLWAESRRDDFARLVNDSVTKLAGICLVISGWMVAAAYPITDLAFRRGRFTARDADETALYFMLFSLSLVFWAVQGLYARAFYAAGDMVRPMVAGTIITLVTVPLYAWLRGELGVIGLVLASNIAILLHTVVLAIMLHTRRMVLLSGLTWGELAKATVAAAISCIAGFYVGRPLFFGTMPRMKTIVELLLITVTWAAAALVVLWLTRSKLLQLRRIQKKA